MLKSDPRAKNFDPASAVDSSFIQELARTRLVDRSLESKRRALTNP